MPGHLEPEPSTQAPVIPQPQMQTLSPSSGSDNQSDDQPAGAFAAGPGVLLVAQDQNNKDRATVPSACVQCRSKHLKCDGLNPCTRCTSNSFECVYVRSRRGFKGPRKNAQNKGNAISSVSVAPVVTPATRACPLVYPNASKGPQNVASGLVTPPETKVTLLAGSANPPPSEIPKGLGHFDTREVSTNLDPKERCIEAFYFHFHPAHPFLLPRSEFMALRKKRKIGHLEAAMRYVGSFYITQAPTTTLSVEAETSIYEVDCPDDGFRVQAMLILAIGLDGYTLQEKALRILLDAQDLALSLGMNKREYSFINGIGSSVLEESWRRTWWELYIVDGMIAGVHQRSSFRLNEIEAEVGLPCEEKEYESGVCNMTFSKFENPLIDIKRKYHRLILCKSLMMSHSTNKSSLSLPLPIG